MARRAVPAPDGELSVAKKEDGAAYEQALRRVADHLERIAGPPVDGDQPMHK